MVCINASIRALAKVLMKFTARQVVGFRVGFLGEHGGDGPPCPYKSENDWLTDREEGRR